MTTQAGIMNRELPNVIGVLRTDVQCFSRLAAFRIRSRIHVRNPGPTFACNSASSACVSLIVIVADCLSSALFGGRPRFLVFLFMS